VIAAVHVCEGCHRHVAGFAINPGLFPDGVITVGAGIIIGGELADVAIETGRIEGVQPFFPVDHFIRFTIASGQARSTRTEWNDKAPMEDPPPAESGKHKTVLIPK